MPETQGCPEAVEFKLLAVIVLYKVRPVESAAFNSLRTAISHDATGAINIKLLLYDNTPGGCHPGALPTYAIYEAAQRNEGLSGAYNNALKMAKTEGFTWLLTLDYDTTLPPHFLARMRELALKFEADSSVAAIVPQLSDAGRLLSPAIVRPWGETILPRGFRGIPKGETHAFNSASLFRVRALQQIGGFDRYFWLDFLDAWVYRQLHHHGNKVYVAGDLQVEHELSLLNPSNKLTPERFNNFLKAESAYIDLYGGTIRGLALTARLFGRLYRQRKRRIDVAIRRLTGECLKRRLFQSKERRVRNWKKEMEAHGSFPMRGKDAEFSGAARPDISVCMAAYNGERYIAAQLQSILCQLAEGDELIVVDDVSSDKTVEIVERFRDPRIRIIRNRSNIGVVGTFERAILEARGEIIFLSDQDDLWRRDKVSRLLDVFKDQKITLAVSDASIIDADGKVISPSFLQTRGGFVPGVLQNILFNRYVGCTMAFRRNVMKFCLPFPRKLPMHDSWIGIVNDAFGKTCFLDEPLVNYRRHTQNVSRTGDRMQQIGWRLNLLSNIVRLRIRKATGNASTPS